MLFITYYWQTGELNANLNHFLTICSLLPSLTVVQGTESWGCSQQPVMLHLCCTFMATLCPCSTWVPPTGCHPSPADCTWVSHRLQLSQPSCPTAGCSLQASSLAALLQCKLLLHGPLWGCREIFLCGWSSSCPLALILVPPTTAVVQQFSLP